MKTGFLGKDKKFIDSLDIFNYKLIKFTFYDWKYV